VTRAEVTEKQKAPDRVTWREQEPLLRSYIVEFIRGERITLTSGCCLVHRYVEHLGWKDQVRIQNLTLVCTEDAMPLRRIFVDGPSDG
jgi:hypothetical protein